MVSGYWVMDALGIFKKKAIRNFGQENKPIHTICREKT
jgi:hypothetical protein